MYGLLVTCQGVWLMVAITCSVVGYKYVWATVIYCYMSSKSIVSTGCPHTVSCRVVVHVRLLMQVSVLLIRSKEEKNRKFL